jgi:hypothetical protein
MDSNETSSCCWCHCRRCRIEGLIRRSSSSIFSNDRGTGTPTKPQGVSRFLYSVWNMLTFVPSDWIFLCRVNPHINRQSSLRPPRNAPSPTRAEGSERATDSNETSSCCCCHCRRRRIGTRETRRSTRRRCCRRRRRSIGNER